MPHPVGMQTVRLSWARPGCLQRFCSAVPAPKMLVALMLVAQACPIEAHLQHPLLPAGCAQAHGPSGHALRRLLTAVQVAQGLPQPDAGLA